MEMREKIAEYLFIRDHSIKYPLYELKEVWKQSKKTQGRDYQEYCIQADNILALFPSLDELEVVGECTYGDRIAYHAPNCPECNGTGEVTRSLAWEDIDINKLINDVINLNKQQMELYTGKLHYLYNPLSLQTSDGGKVRRKISNA
uniref:Uncharacterized protein n=1 Tax=viral metagenome TaxID=1070528 RepID=A0A6H1ZA70_9ZZZZ